jgi:hypothetical protein
VKTLTELRNYGIQESGLRNSGIRITEFRNGIYGIWSSRNENIKQKKKNVNSAFYTKKRNFKNKKKE